MSSEAFGNLAPGDAVFTKSEVYAHILGNGGVVARGESSTLSAHYRLKEVRENHEPDSHLHLNSLFPLLGPA